MDDLMLLAAGGAIVLGFISILGKLLPINEKRIFNILWIIDYLGLSAILLWAILTK